MACRRGGKVSGTLWEHDETRGGLRARRVWCVPHRIHSGSADHASGEWCRRAVEGPRQDLSLPTSRNNLYPWHHQWPCIPFPLMQLDSCISRLYLLAVFRPCCCVSTWHCIDSSSSSSSRRVSGVQQTWPDCCWWPPLLPGTRIWQWSRASFVRWRESGG